MKKSKNIFRIFAITSILTINCFAQNDNVILRDSEIEKVIYDIAKPIIEYAGLSSNKLKIRIIDSVTLNAFATSDMEIYVYSSLLTKDIEPSMLVGVLAHEIGHLKGAHVLQRMKKLSESDTGTLGLILLGGLASMASSNHEPFIGSFALAGQLRERSLLHFSRSQESQADIFALNAIKELHYPYEGFLSFFKSSRNNGSQLNLNSYGSTHPSNPDRIEHIQEYIKINHLTNNLHLDSQIEKDFRRAIIKLKAYLTKEEQDIELIADNMSIEEKKYAYAIFWYKKDVLDKANNLVKELILLSKNDPFYHELLSEILYGQGKITEAVAGMTKVANMIPNNSLINLQLASYEIQLSSQKTTSKTLRENLLNQAITRLKFISSQEEDNSAVYRLLATAYGKKNQLGLSNLYLAKESFLINDLQKAILFAQKAKDNLKTNSHDYWEAESILKDSDDKRKKL